MPSHHLPASPTANEMAQEEQQVQPSLRGSLLECNFTKGNVQRMEDSRTPKQLLCAEQKQDGLKDSSRGFRGSLRSPHMKQWETAVIHESAWYGSQHRGRF